MPTGLPLDRRRPWGQGPPPPNPLQAKPIPSSKRSQSLRGQRAVSWVPSSAILSTQGLGLQEDALHGRDPLLVSMLKAWNCRQGRDSGVTAGHRGPSGAPWVSPSGSSLCNLLLRMDTPGVLSPRLFPGWAWTQGSAPGVLPPPIPTHSEGARVGSQGGVRTGQELEGL